MSHSVIASSTLCIDCHTCEAACSEAHRQHGLQSMPRLKVMLNEKESVPRLYHQYGDAFYATMCSINVINRVDGAVQLGESLCVSCKLCGIARSFGAIELSGSRPLYIPANTNTPEVPPAPPAPTHVSSPLGWAPGVYTITTKCDLCSFDRQGLVCMRMCPAETLRLVNSMDITRASKCKRELTFNTDFSNLTLSQQA